MKVLNKRYVVQIRDNRTYEYKNLKHFSSLDRAKQSLLMLRKHSVSIFYPNQYDFYYRLFDKQENIIIS